MAALQVHRAGYGVEVGALGSQALDFRCLKTHQLRHRQRHQGSAYQAQRSKPAPQPQQQTRTLLGSQAGC